MAESATTPMPGDARDAAEIATAATLPDTRPDSGSDTGPEAGGVTSEQLLDVQRDLRQAAVEVGWLRLMLDVSGPSSAPLLAHIARAQLHATGRALTAGLAVLALAVGLVALVAPAGDAQAAAVPLSAPVRVVLDGPTATLRAQVVATAPTTAHGSGRYIAVSAPLYGGPQVRVGTFAAASAIVPVSITQPARAFVLGRSTWMTRDLGDGRLTTLPVDARQASRITAAYAVAQGGGVATATVWVTHYSAARGAWTNSAWSPVLVQTWTGSSWATVATLTTDATGWATGPVPAAGDALRFVRPDGAQVWGSSTVRAIEAPAYGD